MVRSILLGFFYLLNTVWICFQFYVLQAYHFHYRNDISRYFKAFQFKMDQQNKQTCLSITRYLYIIYSTFTILQIRFLVLKKNHEWLNVVITYLLYSSWNFETTIIYDLRNQRRTKRIWKYSIIMFLCCWNMCFL